MPAGPEPTTATFFPDFCDGGSGSIQPLLEGAVGDRAFDGLDGHRIVVEIERAGCFARRRADAAGDLGEIVGALQIARRFLPVAAIDEIVPVRDLVVHRTSGVAIGNAAIHAARGLRARLAFRQRQQEFAPMLDALLDRFVMAVVALVFQETGDLARAAIANFVLIDSPM
jgi:hypothetical protein